MEEFIDIKGYEGFYQVSNKGRVKSFVKWRGRSSPRILSSPLNSDGYPMVGLVKEGVRKTIKVHVLVALTFLDHKPNGNKGLVVDHINNIKTDNKLSNLQLITHRQNSSKRLKKYTSKYVGVSWRKDRHKWTSRINIGSKYKSLGVFDNEVDAHLAYQKALSDNKILNSIFV